MELVILVVGEGRHALSCTCCLVPVVVVVVVVVGGGGDTGNSISTHNQKHCGRKTPFEISSDKSLYIPVASSNMYSQSSRQPLKVSSSIKETIKRK